MIWHRIRGHKIEPFRVIDATRPWRWQCSCGHIFGGEGR